MESRDRSSLDRVLDVAVYGPVGLALAARDSLPKWVDAGRRQLGSQLTMARTIGRLAVDEGSRQAGGVLRRLAEEAEGVLVALGLAPADDDLDDDAHDPEAAGVPTSPPPTTNGAEAPLTPAGTATAAAAVHPSGLGAAELAIPGYDTLSASQIVQRLPGLSPEELEAVRLYELAGRSRKTVLLRVAQLKAGS
ncbi:MAG TPA: hypothetical protein VG455_12715 [Acidimicrobiales bacterium]|nr:hypothetical protein [Acidimicrobiales bacterium]